MVQIRLSVGKEASKRPDYISSVDIYELFPNSFMEEFTKCKNIVDFCQAIGCDITSQEDLNKLQDTGAYNNAIFTHSNFASWQEMVETACQKLLEKK